jgi:hemolysin activation/secretion protein
MTKLSMTRHLLAPLGLALLLAGLNSTAQAQALPQAGQVGREGQAVVPPRETNPITVSPLIPPAPATAVASVSVKVSSFKFVGNNSIRDSELQKVVAASVDQALDLAGLDQVASKVSRYYRSKGYTVATAYLPPQQSLDGAIQIAVIEGQYGNVNLKNSSSVSTPLLQRYIANNLCEGIKPADCKASLIQDIELERAVLLIKDLPGISAVSSLKPGAATGTSDLEMDVKDMRASTYSIGFDNYGSKVTGVVRLNASAEYNNPNNNGDQLTLGLTTTGKLSNTGSIGYSFPVGYAGGRMGLAFARGHYRLGDSLANLGSLVCTPSPAPSTAACT